MRGASVRAGPQRGSGELHARGPVVAASDRRSSPVFLHAGRGCGIAGPVRIRRAGVDCRSRPNSTRPAALCAVQNRGPIVLTGFELLPETAVHRPTGLTPCANTFYLMRRLPSEKKKSPK